LTGRTLLAKLFICNRGELSRLAATKNKRLNSFELDQVFINEKLCAVLHGVFLLGSSLVVGCSWPKDKERRTMVDDVVALLCFINAYLSVAMTILIQLNYALALFFSSPTKEAVPGTGSEE